MAIMDYFKSEKDAIIFGILHTDQELKEQILGIDMSLYESKDNAKEWYSRLFKVLNHGNPHKDEDTAMLKLGKLYDRMKQV